MKRKIVIGDMATESGPAKYAVEAGPCVGHVISASAVIVAVCDGVRQVVSAGTGRLDFDVTFPSAGVLEVIPLKPGVEASLFLEHWPAVGPAVGWDDGDSFAQLDLKSRDAISPEVSAVLDRMQRNMRLMELKLQGIKSAQ